MKHISEKSKKHEQTRTHIENAMKLAMFGKLNIAAQLDEGHRIEIRKYNEEIDKNRHILTKIIDCVKFCGAFELALRGHDESESSENPGIFRGLVDFVASLDGVLEEHLRTATAFKGTSKTVQNELLNCMLSVLRESIIEEIRNADFVSIQADETIDISTQRQLVLVVRYIDKANNVHERFFEFIPLVNATTDSIATALLQRLSTILPHDQKAKLICQTYDGASVMRGGVQKRIKDVYVNAHYIHSYAHQLNLIMQQATSHITRVSHFFSDLGGFHTFFARSPKRTSVLDGVVSQRLPRASSQRWNFHSQAVNTVFEYKDDLLRCFETIRGSGEFDPTTVREAGGFVRLLEDGDFNFFLDLFHKIMPHVDILYSQLQKRTIDPVYVKGIIQQFTNSMQKIRDSLPTFCGQHSGAASQQQQAKRQRTLAPGENQKMATEVCDTILAHTKERFFFTKHLTSATLLQGEMFQQHRKQFPEAALKATIEAYPVLNKNKLKTELSLIYSHDEFKNCKSALAVYHLFMENNLQDTFSETVTLLKILITTPMITTESERCFSTLKRIKTFLRNIMTQDHLNALAMLSMEKKLTKDIPDFNRRVIEKFASVKERERFLFGPPAPLYDVSNTDWIPSVNVGHQYATYATQAGCEQHKRHKEIENGNLKDQVHISHDNSAQINGGYQRVGCSESVQEYQSLHGVKVETENFLIQESHKALAEITATVKEEPDVSPSSGISNIHRIIEQALPSPGQIKEEVEESSSMELCEDIKEFVVKQEGEKFVLVKKEDAI
ncbi:zinc finger MYM-type protein 1-like [Polymixia lowei]